MPKQKSYDGYEIRIGTLIYKVKEVEGLKTKEIKTEIKNGKSQKPKEVEIPSHGNTDFANCEIQLEAKLSNEYKKVVLWHEIFHALLANAGSEETYNEKIVDLFAYGTVGLLQDNPFLRSK